ncbi:MAG: cytochrome c1 [Gammaproteobacteria bacterium]|nr:cytochrome c1 [Gammaproteobacteria bacterium]
MKSSMSKEDAKNWFGAAPPDLTMVTRVRSPKWVYNFLKTFYIDDKRPFGVNNKVFPNVGMPHVLLPLQGFAVEDCFGYEAVDLMELESILREKKLEGILTRTDRETEVEPWDRLEGREPNCPELTTIPETGLYNVEQFDQAAYDLANFLHYMGDPSREIRQSMGGYVIVFLVILTIFAYFLKREYWKDVPKSPPRVRKEHTSEL